MKNLIIIQFLSFLAFNSFGATITAISSGNWTNAAIWNLGRIPQSGDDIMIPSGRAVAIPAFTDINLTGTAVTTVTVMGTLNTGLLGSITINDGDGDLIRVGQGGRINGLGGIWFLPSFDLIAPFFEPGGVINGPATLQNGTLPIELASFEVGRVEGGVLVEWATASEENNDYFEVLRSRDGSNYDVIATVDGAGNSNSLLTYSYQDSNPLMGQSYYMLKQTDFDGQNESFEAKSVYVEPPAALVFFPNPVEAGEQISVFTNKSLDEVMSLTIMDLAGNRLLKKEVNPKNMYLDIPVSLKRGIYFIELRSSKSNEVKRLLIK